MLFFLMLWIEPIFGTATLAQSTAPLIQASDFTCLGAFALPTGNYGTSRFGYGGKGLAYYKDPSTGKHTLFMEGHAWYPGNVAQVEVPADARLVKSDNWSSLNTATVLQSFADVTDGQLGGLAGSASFVYGLLAYNGRLMVGASCYYDGASSQVNSHGVSGLTLSTTNDFQGFFPMNGVATPRSKGGYMTTIPAEWQPLLGGPALTGKGCLSIISNNSSGPCATVFDPDDAGVKNPIPAMTLIFYPLEHPLAPNDGQNNYFNLATHMAGIAFPPGSRSLLFFGRQGIGPYCYGEGSVCNDLCDASKGTHAYPYRQQVWAYDANDLLQVKNGTKQCWEMQPYAVWAMDEITRDCADMEGAGYDPETGRLYITESYGEEPHVHVYQITVPGTGIKDARQESCPPLAGFRLTTTPSGILVLLDGSSASVAQLRLYDVGGRLLSSQTRPILYHTTIWKMEDRSNGIYLVEIAAGALKSRKLVSWIR